MKLVGLKNNAISPEKNEYADQLQQYHDPLEYDYGDYVEGYQNYAKPQRPKTVPERIAKWFTGFRIPSAKRVRYFSNTSDCKKVFDKGDYVEGYQNYVKPQRFKTVSE